MRAAVKNVLTVARSMVRVNDQLTTRAGPVRIMILSALIAQDEMEEMIVGEDFLKSLGIDPHEILAAQLENETLEAEIDATKMGAGEEAKEQNLSLTKLSANSDSGEKEMKLASTSQSPAAESGDDCF